MWTKKPFTEGERSRWSWASMPRLCDLLSCSIKCNGRWPVESYLPRSSFQLLPSVWFILSFCSFSTESLALQMILLQTLFSFFFFGADVRLFCQIGIERMTWTALTISGNAGDTALPKWWRRSILLFRDTRLLTYSLLDLSNVKVNFFLFLRRVTCRQNVLDERELSNSKPRNSVDKSFFCWLTIPFARACEGRASLGLKENTQQLAQEGSDKVRNVRSFRLAS